jgi:group I intron endonuclease
MFIYKITNKINKKYYIGQTICSLQKRWREHCSSNKCTALSRAIKKYGKENFVIEEIDGANNLSELNYKEWLYILKFNSVAPKGYNLKEGGNNKKYSSISKNRMSQSQKGKILSKETREKISMSKKNPSEETRRRISLAKKQYRASEATKEKQRKNWNPKSIEHSKNKVVDINTGKIYESVTKTALELNIPRRTLVRLLNKQTRPAKKYINYKLSYL